MKGGCTGYSGAVRWTDAFVIVLVCLWVVQQATLESLGWDLTGYGLAIVAIGLLVLRWRAARQMR